MKALKIQPPPQNDPGARAPRLELTTGLFIFVLMLFGCILMLLLYVSQAHAAVLCPPCCCETGAPGGASESGVPVLEVPQGRPRSGSSPDPKPVGRALDAPLDTTGRLR
jgi:hypothetical protein